MRLLKVLVMRIARGGWERCEIADWIAGAYTLGHPLVETLTLGRMDKEPTTAARNSAVAVAREIGADILFQIDADMAPAEAFFAHAVEHLARRPGAVVIGSPYCGAPPGRLVQVMRRGEDARPLRVTREEAARQSGTALVEMIGTGLLAANVAAFDILDPPYFGYDFDPADPQCCSVSATEDFSFCRRLTAAGGRVYAAWNCWSSHCKTEIIGKPEG